MITLLKSKGVIYKVFIQAVQLFVAINQEVPHFLVDGNKELYSLYKNFVNDSFGL